MKKEKFNLMLEDIKEISDLFEQQLIFIGGIATYLYSIENEMPEEFSHDADFTISDGDYIDLKDLYSINENKRLKKSEIIINGIEYDVYKGSNSSLLFTHDELAKNAVISQGIAIPSLEHLLCLKMIAYSNRKDSNKGDKDARDLIKIINCFNKNNPNKEILNNIPYYLKQEIILNLNNIFNQFNIFSEICAKNHKEANKLREKFKQNLDKIVDILNNTQENTPIQKKNKFKI